MTRQEEYEYLLSKNSNQFLNTARCTYAWAVSQRRQKKWNETMQVVTSYVVAPVIYAYVDWLLLDATHRRIQRLYFLSRDGYQMIRVAEQIKKSRHYNIELRYLCCSRHALQLPALHLQENYIDRICTGGKALHLTEVLQRGGLSNQEIDQVMYSQGMEEQSESILSYQQVQNLKNKLVENTYFCNLVKQHSQDSYDACIGYLRQEGLFDNISYAIVDSGWTGSMQAALQKLLESNGYQKPMEGYYFGLYEIPDEMKASQYHTFYFSPKGMWKRKMWFNNNLFEVLFSAPEGMTSGYQKTENGYVPIINKNNREAEFYDEQLEIILRFCAEQHISLINPDNSEEIRRKLGKSIAEVLKTFMTYPSREEAIYYGSMEFSDHVLESGTTMLAEPVGRDVLKANHLLARFHGMRKGVYVPTSFWLMGSLARYGCGRIEKWWHRIQILAYYYALYIKKDLKRKT
ncbi:MAG: hypothetical protein J6K43_09295 [Lachnospiraceae bacterium]|nr:hypothetical protein [Lachnospiraceae bacterium]